MNAISIQQLERPKKREANEVFRLGEEIVFKVTGIEKYGVFGVKVFEGEEYTGLVHKSIINNNNSFVRIERHFKVGDIVKGKVKSFDNKGNMSISTADHFSLLPDYDAPKVVKVESKETAEEKEIMNDLNTEHVIVNDEIDTIYTQIKPTLETTLRLISPEAEIMFKELIREVGVVKFCMSLGKIAPQFYVDPGKMLAKAITNDIKECL